MPYIDANLRPGIDRLFNTAPPADFPKNAGELNYSITIIIKEYFKRGRRYQHVNDIRAALTCVEQLFLSKDIIVELNKDYKAFVYFDAKNSNQLKSVIFNLCREYFMKNTSMEVYAQDDIIGALGNAKDEFYRRVAVPYETYKIKENGDVYADVFDVYGELPPGPRGSGRGPHD